MEKYLYLQIYKNKRLFVVSDIHGRYDLLERLLKRVNYSQEDYLFILGDLTRKGPFPLKTLRYIMKLNESPNCYCLIGNCDVGEIEEFIPKYIDSFTKSLTYNSLQRDMYNEYIDLNGQNDMDPLDLQKTLLAHFKPEIDFLKSLYLMIETEEFIFVHAGIENRIDYLNSDPHLMITKRYFYKMGHCSNKIVICGHFPTTIYSLNEMNDDIIIDLTKKIICCDGGNVVKTFGQLNLLEIAYGDAIKFGKHSQTDYQTYLVKRQKKNQSSGGVCYPFYKFQIIKKKKYFTKILTEDNRLTFIKNEFIKEFATGFQAVDDCPAEILELNNNDEVLLLSLEYEGYALIKKNSHCGWVKKTKLRGIKK